MEVSAYDWLQKSNCRTIDVVDDSHYVFELEPFRDCAGVCTSYCWNLDIFSYVAFATR